MNKYLVLINGQNAFIGTEKKATKLYESLKGERKFVTLVEVIKSCETVYKKLGV